MEKEINELKEDKEKMRKEIDELKKEENKKERTSKGQIRTRGKTRETESNKKLREELFPPLPAPGPSDITRSPTKTRGSAEEFEEREEDVTRVGR